MLQTEGLPAEPITLGDAVKAGIIANEMLGYFIGRTYLFAKAIGLKEEMLRFRQHQSGEMAHYATDCWDMEVLSSFGWIECVGLADRSAYDLTAHMKGSGEKLMASRTYEKPINREFVTYDVDKPLLGKTFKQASKAILERLEEMTNEDGLGVLAITHYARLLTELRPDRIHVLMGGRVVVSGGPELADTLEAQGYEGLAAELGVEDLAIARTEVVDPFSEPGF